MAQLKTALSCSWLIRPRQRRFPGVRHWEAVRTSLTRLSSGSGSERESFTDSHRYEYVIDYVALWSRQTQIVTNRDPNGEHWTLGTLRLFLEATINTLKETVT